MFTIKDEPQTAEEVWQRARSTYSRMAVQRRREELKEPEPEPTLPPTEEALAMHPTEPPKPPVPTPLPPKFNSLIRLERIVIQIVAEEYNVSVVDMLGTKRVQSIVRPRQIAMWVVKKISPTRSYPRIGRSFGGRDHTTVIHAVRTIDAMRERGELSSDLLDALVLRCSQETAEHFAPREKQCGTSLASR